MTISQVYEEGRQRITELVVGLTAEEAARGVLTCPLWSVGDVVAHLTGICDDVLAGNIAGVATDEWTRAQVLARRGRSVAEIVEEWSLVGPQVEAFADHFPDPAGPQWVADLTTHEHDIRSALRRPGARDSAGVGVSVEFLVTVGLQSSVTDRDAAPLEVRAGGRCWTVGRGDSPVGAVEANPFELMRALTGRRSPSQIRALHWTVDPSPYIPAFQFGPFTTSPIDIDE